MTGERMRIVLMILMNAQAPLSAKSIVNKMTEMGCSITVNTIYTIVDQLNAFFRLFFDEDIIMMVKKQGISLKTSFLEDGQMQFLLDAIAFNRDLSLEDQHRLNERLQLLMPLTQRQRLNMATHDQHHHYSLITYLSTILQAIDRKQTIAFEYVDYAIVNHHPQEVASKRGSHGSLYVVSPYRIILDQNHYYLIGCFSNRKDRLSMYRIDRMRKVMSYRSTFIDITEQYDMDAFIHQSFNMFVNGEPIDLDITFDASLLREIVSRYGQDMTIDQLHHHQYRAVIPDVMYSQGLIMWLMMHGSRLFVNAPFKLKEVVKAEYQKVIDGYKK